MLLAAHSINEALGENALPHIPIEQMIRGDTLTIGGNAVFSEMEPSRLSFFPLNSLKKRLASLW